MNKHNKLRAAVNKIVILIRRLSVRFSFVIVLVANGRTIKWNSRFGLGTVYSIMIIIALQNARYYRHSD